MKIIDGNTVVSVAEMRQSDAWTIKNLTDSKTLMSRAGQAVVDNVDWNNCNDKKILIVCGKGNNAGDGYVIARLLKEKDYTPELMLLYSDSFSEDGKYFFDRCVDIGVSVTEFNREVDFSEYGIIVDCIFGTGFHGNATGKAAEIISKINESGAYVVSVDINSGLNGDTGLGEVFVKSDITISIGNYKYGHFTGNSSIAMKKKVNCDIGIVLQT